VGSSLAAAPRSLKGLVEVPLPPPRRGRGTVLDQAPSQRRNAGVASGSRGEENLGPGELPWWSPKAAAPRLAGVAVAVCEAGAGESKPEEEEGSEVGSLASDSEYAPEEKLVSV